MNLALLRTGLRLSRTAFISWALGLGLLVVFVVALYPSVRDVGGLQEYLESLPESFQVMLGSTGFDSELLFPDGVYDFRAYLNDQYLILLPVMVGVYAVFYCGGLVSREVERGTLDMLLSHPLARWQFVATKFATFALLVSGIALVSWALVVALMPLVDATGSIAYVGLAHIVAVLLVLAIGGYCTLFSCRILEPGKALAASGIVTVALYFLNILAPLADSISWLQKASPFYYFNALELLYFGRVDWVGIGVYVGMLVGGLLASLLVFERRDILK